jgi:hypothetical protein
MDSAVAEMRSICRRYSAADVDAFLPYLLVAFAPAFDAAAIPPAALDALGALVARLGVKDAADAPAALQAHFKANPPNAKLVGEFERLFRARTRAAIAASSVLPPSTSDARTKVLSTVGAQRPVGTVAAGPFARFHAQTQTQTQTQGS